MAMHRERQNGFTLIELMITVAIIAILASVAYPSYTKYIARGKRAAAQAVMMNVGNKQEQFMLNARSYHPVGGGDSTDFGPLQLTVPVDVSGSYDLKITAATTMPPAWTVTATPKPAQASNDATCGVLTLNSTGAKAASTGSATCW